VTRPPLLAIVVSHPIQYQAPLWRALTADRRLGIRVLYLSRHGVEERLDPGFGQRFAWDVDLLEGYESSFIPTLRAGAAPGGFASHLNPGIVTAVRRLAPDAVLFVGLHNPSSLAALAAARAARVPALYRADSSALESRSGWRPRLVASLLRSISVILTTGTANDLYYDGMGIPLTQRVLAPYSVDNSFFQERVMAQAQARAELGLSQDDYVVLYAGKLVPWKDPLTVVDACAEVRCARPLRFLVAGDGVLRGELEARARERGVELTTLGFVNQLGMATVYSAADVLVLPSRREPWGLVLNEAMNYSLPVLASTQVGAWLDLVHRGSNGEVFTSGSSRELAAQLAMLADDRALSTAYGQQSRAIIEGWGLPATVQGVVEGVQLALRRGDGRCASW
jgi:glycosyltransferase involved in cell wall biosynthesis